MNSTTARRAFFTAAAATVGALTMTVAATISAAYPTSDADRRIAGELLSAGLLATGAAAAAASVAGVAMQRADRRDYLAACDQYRRTMAAIRAAC